MLQLTTAFIICVAIVNLLRMTLYLVGADVYAIRKARSKDRALYYRPSVSLVVRYTTREWWSSGPWPACWRSTTTRCRSSWPTTGPSTTRWPASVAWKEERDPDDVIEVFTQPNGGKADALNNAIRAMATGELVMCLDGDSTLAPDAVTKSVAHFRDPRIVATASNVNILPNGTLLGLVQRYEYLISYHMKKAHSMFNVEYIIGGIGSMFRRSTLDDVGLYDTNTMTEDIDLTMKIIAQKGNRKQRVAYAHDAITYTEAVPSFRSLIRQRYRWKYGRLQTFYKNYRLFFSMQRKHSFGLSWIFLPFALWQEVMYLIEPVIVTAVIAVSIYYRSPWTLVSAMIVISTYVIANILGTVHLSRRDKAVLSLMAPLMYVLLYMLSVVEYIALIWTIVRLPRLRRSISADRVTWTSPERSGAPEGGRHRIGQVQAWHPSSAASDSDRPGHEPIPLLREAQRLRGSVRSAGRQPGETRLPGLRRSISADRVTWTSPERSGAPEGGRHRIGQVQAWHPSSAASDSDRPGHEPIPLLREAQRLRGSVRSAGRQPGETRLPGLRRSISADQVTWTSPERSGAPEGGRHRAERVEA